MGKVTKSYLSYDSDVKMEIIDTYFDSLELPPIKLEFDFYSLLKLENFSSNLFEVFGSNVIKNPNGFKGFNNQIKNWNIFDCKILNDGMYQNCDLSLDNIIDIKSTYVLQGLNYTDYKTMLKDSKFTQNIILTFNLFNPESKAMKIEHSKFLAHKLVQKNFIKIYLNKPELNARYRFAYSEKMFKSGYSGFSRVSQNGNNYPKQADYIIFKKKFSYLKYPFESKCINYGENNDNLFYSLSKDHCIRQCVRYHCESILNCSCLFLDKNIYQIYQIDFGFNNLNHCQIRDQNLKSIKFNFTEKCNTLCPIDCETEEYFMVNRDYVSEEELKSNSSIYSLSWDDSKPYINYNEMPVLTFSAYFCYIGGLFGMWFGISANRLLKKIEDNYLIYFRTIVHYSLVFYYILLEFLLITKVKFQAFL
jgi:hypothetical protein